MRTFRLLCGGIIKALVVVTVLSAISLSFLVMYHYLLASPYLRLERVEMKGADDEIRRGLIKLGELSPHMSLLAVNLRAVKQRMEQHPWVRTVRLEREFPHTLIVEVEQNTPRAVAVMDRLYYVNGLGEVFKEVAEGEETDFPVITGVTGLGPKSSEMFSRAAGLMNFLASQQSPWSLEDLSEIHFSEEGGISVYFKQLGAQIKLTRDYSEGDFEALRKVFNHLSQTGRIHQVTSIDLNYRDGAVVSFRKG